MIFRMFGQFLEKSRVFREKFVDCLVILMVYLAVHARPLLNQMTVTVVNTPAPVSRRVVSPLRFIHLNHMVKFAVDFDVERINPGAIDVDARVHRRRLRSECFPVFLNGQPAFQLGLSLHRRILSCCLLFPVFYHAVDVCRLVTIQRQKLAGFDKTVQISDCNHC